MTNPNNAIGTNAAYNGRTSVNAFNDNLSGYTAGILSGWEPSEVTGMAMAFGGQSEVRDVAIAQDDKGNSTTVNNISGAPVTVTFAAAPLTDTRLDVVVLYVDNPPQGNETDVDNPGSCGIITVKGEEGSYLAPTDADVQAAITADGASGSTAYYIALCLVWVPVGITDIWQDGEIEFINYASSIAPLSYPATQIPSDSITGDKIKLNTIKSYNLDYSTLQFGNYSTSETNTKFTWIDGKTIYKKTISCGALPNATEKTVSHGISNLGRVLKVEGYAYNGTNDTTFPLPFSWATDTASCIGVLIGATTINIRSGVDRTDYTESYITLYYTKSS